MSPPKRQAEIAKELLERHELSIPALAIRFGVSEMTIRRDLDKLEAAGRVRRTHGGAIPAERMAFEFDFAARRQSHRRAKEAIAAEAAKLVKPGATIILDAGTTTLELARVLRNYDNLTVITPSLAVASELHFSQGIQVILLGGLVRKGSPDLTGIVTEAVLDMFRADTAFQGADGIGLDGAMYTADMRVSKVDRKIRSRAERTFVLADSSKIGMTALTRHGHLQEVDGLITDDSVSPAYKQRFEKLHINMTVAKVGK